MRVVEVKGLSCQGAVTKYTLKNLRERNRDKKKLPYAPDLRDLSYYRNKCI